ncbi:UV-stimulated scaffold protein A homolog isoform X2 [Trifolium pratense]|uniref:UV-stimulated scaffold protein A homolog isoform X2 n=1 Tax=Trifolium pratense TaxID=57577 RepID=UPI001E6910B5|nr:UV-stimulated scaffold protein A homolog isoform X2 [Trifolium pratense]
MEEEEKQQHGKGSKVRSLIEMATNSTAPDVDPRLLKAIKTVVRYSDSELRLASQTLMDLMKRDHSQVRYLALQIIDEIFMRSKLFRTLIVENMEQLMSLSVGFRRNSPLPAPPSVASVLRSKAIEFLEKWNVSFGVHYRQLRLGYDYLKNTLRLQFPNIQANVERIQQERRERERRSKEILLNKYESLKEKLPSIKGEILSTMGEIDGCLDILHSKQEHESDDILDDEELDDFRSLELQQLRREALNEGEKVYESSENKVVFDALRELYKLLVTKHLVSIQEWVSVLVRVEVVDNRFRDSTLKEFIDIQNRLKSVKKRCEEAGCSILSTRDGEEDFWEEGDVLFVETSSSAPDNQNKHTDMASTSHNTSSDNLGSYATESKSSKTDSLHHGGNESESNPLRSKLLTNAPVVSWGSHLDTWGSNRVFMANQRGLDLDSHWGRVDDDAVIPSDKIAELSVPAMPYEEKQIEIQPCHAPLRKGGLCRRRDMKICPFHGPIIPRDDEGRPLTTSPSEDVNVNVKTDLVEKLAKQAVKNVRETDKEAAKKREIDKQALKRAKLAKIREHNEAVLRDAALASTSSSAAFGEEDEATKRDKKASLASMLRKKVTSKDRIARKLLSSRAR